MNVPMPWTMSWLCPVLTSPEKGLPNGQVQQTLDLSKVAITPKEKITLGPFTHLCAPDPWLQRPFAPNTILLRGTCLAVGAIQHQDPKQTPRGFHAQDRLAGRGGVGVGGAGSERPAPLQVRANSKAKSRPHNSTPDHREPGTVPKVTPFPSFCPSFCPPPPPPRTHVSSSAPPLKTTCDKDNDCPHQKESEFSTIYRAEQGRL